ncbi:MAG: hypothetical protein Devi2KO_22920 [Devosia indica]
MTKQRNHPPDFSKSTALILSMRAGHNCSNPDCGVLTTGASKAKTTATTIGEAAHIYGARAGTARFKTEMTDQSRSEITNGIWLCRNCHGKIDDDEVLYSAELLYKWRELHEELTASQVGKRGDVIRMDLQRRELSAFSNDPPIVRQILVERALGWEWRLAAALLRSRLAKPERRISDLTAGLYTRRSVVVEDEIALEWVSFRLREATEIIAPLHLLMDGLTTAFGHQGLPGDEQEISHICDLFVEVLYRAIEWEEEVAFAHISEDFAPAVGLLRSLIGSQVSKIGEIADQLDQAADIAATTHEGTTENPKIINISIVFELPVNWEDEFAGVLEKLGRSFMQ